MGIFTIVNAKVRDVKIDSEDNDFIFETGRFPEELLVSVFYRHFSYNRIQNTCNWYIPGM